MLRIQRQEKRFTKLEHLSCVDASITERYDLQEFIFNSPEQFFAEVGLNLFVIGKEVQPSEVIEDRIDLLALDPEGKAIVIELKRGNDRLQLLQAIAYAGMIGKWKAADFLSLLDADRREKLEEFLNGEIEDINREQRIMLIAEAYDYEVLVGAEWLHDNYQLDILCCRISLSKDAGSGAEYLICTPVFPAPELAREAVPRRRQLSQPIPWADWEGALADLSNHAIADYFRSQLEASRESYLPDRDLIYRINGKRRWIIAARDNRAYCWQMGRFDGDVEFWSKRLSNSDSTKAVQKGRALRFFVSTASDFSAFRNAVTKELLGANWIPELPETVLGDGNAQVGNQVE